MQEGESEEDKCPKCGHERKYHYAVDGGDNTVDAWCGALECWCDEIFGGIPGRPGTDDHVPPCPHCGALHLFVEPGCDKKRKR